MDLTSLNDKQREAVTAPLGPVLVLAGAGSGKTRALAYRIAYVCKQNMAAPENILALTFTNKAAKEMQERVHKILSEESPSASPDTAHGPTINPRIKGIGGGPHMGTFHSMCAKILRQEIPAIGYTRGFVIMDSEDQAKVIREIIQELGITKKYGPSFFRAYISMAKNVLQTPEEFTAGLDADMENLVREVYRRYQNFLFNQNSLDFDDLLMLTVKIFQNIPEVLKKYQTIFQYILVDEYQDTNHAQYQFLYLLAQHSHNLFVVGDDAQSIYGFRGSSIRNILNFEEDFPEAKVIKLEQNYRSTKNILSVAQKIIELNPEQKKKTLWTDNEDGKKIIVQELGDEHDEAVFVAKKIIAGATGQELTENEYVEEPASESFSILDHFIRKQKKQFGAPFLGMLPQLPRDHKPLTQFAILFRTHAQSRALEEVLMGSGIPYQIVGGLRFYERKEIKDVIAYLRLAMNYRDLMSLKRVINEPPRGVGDKSYGVLKEFILQQSMNAAGQGKESGQDRAPLSLGGFLVEMRRLPLGAKAMGGAVEFFKNIERFSILPEEEDLPSLMRLILKTVNFEEYLKDGTEVGEARWENVQELSTVVEKYRGLPWKEGLTAFLEEVALITEVDEKDEDKDGVTLMTLHSAKGLEFDTVFLVGLEEGILPHSRSIYSPAELSEEIRLAYVGLTRARQELYLTYTRQRRAFGSQQYNLPSRILRALPQDKIVFNGRMDEGDNFEVQDNVYEEEEF